MEFSKKLTGSPDLAQQTKDIHKKLFTGSAFMLVTRLLVKSIGLVSSIILARLLVPEDFGLVAIAMAIYGFIELFGAFGLGTVLIQKKNTTDDDYNTAWTFKVLFGCVAAITLVFIAPLVAGFYQDNRLTAVIYAISVMSVLSGFNNIGVIDFQKNLDFKRELQLQVIPKLFSFICTMTLVLMLRNYWALVFGMLINELLNLCFSFLMNKFRPRFSLASASELFHFSKWLVINNSLDYVNKRVPVLLTGQLLDSKAVGLYTLGAEIASIPTSEIAAPINKATYPVYAKFKEDKAELRKAYLNTINLSASVSLPAAVGIAFLAPVLVPTVLGPAWVSMTDMMQWLAVAGFIISLSSNVGYVFMATGSPRYLVFTNLLRAAIFIPSLYWSTTHYGLTGIGYALLLTASIMLVVTHISITKLLNLQALSVIRVTARAILASIIMCAGLFVYQKLAANLPDIILLLTAIASGALIYSLSLLGLWYVVGRPEGIEQIVVSRYLNNNKITDMK